MITPGTPENVNPSTLYSHVQCKPIWYQMPGIVGLRCGSLARIGAPLAVSRPLITHELEPMPWPVPSMTGSSPRPSATALIASAASVAGAAEPGTVAGAPEPGTVAGAGAGEPGAAGSNAPSTTAPPA